LPPIILAQSIHTAKHKPWRLITYVAFADAAKAIAFERYLKSPSGRAFANKGVKEALRDQPPGNVADLTAQRAAIAVTTPARLL
jgi:predicted GIY-YIG superfamily endonuclease